MMGSIPSGRSTRNKKEKGFTNEMKKCKIYLKDLTDDAKKRFLDFLGEEDEEAIDEKHPITVFTKE